MDISTLPNYLSIILNEGRLEIHLSFDTILITLDDFLKGERLVSSKGYIELRGDNLEVRYNDGEMRLHIEYKLKDVSNFIEEISDAFI